MPRMLAPFPVVPRQKKEARANPSIRREGRGGVRQGLPRESSLPLVAPQPLARPTRCWGHAVALLDPESPLFATLAGGAGSSASAETFT
jgi:hypothetical protein